MRLTATNPILAENTFGIVEVFLRSGGLEAKATVFFYPKETQISTPVILSAELRAKVISLAKKRFVGRIERAK